MLLKPFEYNMVGVPTFNFAEGGEERLQRDLTAVFDEHKIQNDRATIANVRHDIADEFDFILYPHAGSNMNAIVFHFIVYTYEGHLIAEIPTYMSDYAHDIATIIAREFLQVELQRAPRTRYGESSPTFTIEGTYKWFTQKWPRVQEQIRKIEAVLDNPKAAAQDRWKLFIPGIMPKNQILPYIEPHHVRQIHLVLQEFRRKGDCREYKARHAIFYPYGYFLRELLMDKVLPFLPPQFKAKLGSLYWELMQLGANFHSVEASMCVLDHHFMTRCGNHQNHWEEQYTRRYNEFVDALTKIAGYVKEHDESVLNKHKGNGGPVNPSSREERQLNENKLKKALHDAAFAMLGLTKEKRKEAMKEYAKGKHWAVALDMRPNLVGEIIDIKGNLVKKGKKPNDVAQLYFLICSNEDHFNMFEDIENSHNPPRAALALDEHARRLKNEIEKRK